MQCDLQTQEYCIDKLLIPKELSCILFHDNRQIFPIMSPLFIRPKKQAQEMNQFPIWKYFKLFWREKKHYHTIQKKKEKADLYYSFRQFLPFHPFSKNPVLNSRKCMSDLFGNITSISIQIHFFAFIQTTLSIHNELPYIIFPSQWSCHPSSHHPIHCYAPRNA